MDQERVWKQVKDKAQEDYYGTCMKRRWKRKDYPRFVVYITGTSKDIMPV